ncbi:MAG: DUF2958 domain-containing protein [Crocinitomicaceae bacterium]|nr:DUF2958 domain-containing protein [Crocinitomicaceae bacterium]
MKTLSQDIERLMKDYPLYSQDGLKNPLVVVKLFSIASEGRWFLTEYDPKTQEAFGYVTGLGHDELGYTSISELESLIVPKLSFIEPIGGKIETIDVSKHKVPAIERDISFEPIPIWDLFPQLKKMWED